MKYRRGMTLIELILAIGILAVVMLFFTMAVRTVMISYRTQKEVAEKKDAANQIASVLKDKIHKESGGIAIADSNPDASVYQACYYSNQTGLATSGGDLSEIPASLFSGSEVHVHFAAEGHDIAMTVTVDGYELSLTAASLNPDLTPVSAGSASDNWLCLQGGQ